MNKIELVISALNLASTLIEFTKNLLEFGILRFT